MTHQSTNGVFLSENIVEPHPDKESNFGLRENAERAIRCAAAVIGKKEREPKEKDYHGVRALATCILKTLYPNRYSYPDLAQYVYRARRKRHNKAMDGYYRWRNNPKLKQAIELFNQGA